MANVHLGYYRVPIARIYVAIPKLILDRSWPTLPFYLLPELSIILCLAFQLLLPFVQSYFMICFEHSHQTISSTYSLQKTCLIWIITEMLHLIYIFNCQLEYAMRHSYVCNNQMLQKG